MTVCIAAAAKEWKAIVLVADKALTHGSGFVVPAMEGETGAVEKRLPIGESGWHALFAGNPTVAEEVVRGITDALEETPEASKEYAAMMELTAKAYQRIGERHAVDDILRPRLLSKETFMERGSNLLPLDDFYFRQVADEV